MNARDKQWLLELTHEHPTPTWVLFSRVPQARYFELADCFKGLAKELRICYSVKTNPHPAILSSLSKMECGFEISSARELAAVKSFSTPKVMNGCAHADAEIIEALAQKTLIMVDSLSHARQIALLVPAGAPFEVGIRLRLDNHRFGFSASELKTAISSIEALGLRVTALHAHPGTNCTLNQYRNFISQVAAIVLDFPQVKILDIGGGLPGKTNLMERKETLEMYAGIIKEQLGEFLRSRVLVVESGRFLSEDSMVLLSQVKHTKQVEGQWFALLDVGINVLPRVSMCPFRFFVLSESGDEKAHFRLGGPLLFGSDELGQVHGKLGKGDIIAIENTGAYCTELAWHLSRDGPKIVVIE